MSSDLNIELQTRCLMSKQVVFIYIKNMYNIEVIIGG